MTLEDKLLSLKALIKSYGSVAIGFSGGVDSTFLSRIAFDVLHDKAVAFTSVSASFPEREERESRYLADLIGIRQIFFESGETLIPGFRNNPPDRCYYCKTELYTCIKQAAEKEGLNVVLDGSNADDARDFRPGLRALKELNIRSPLKDAGLTKEEIRHLSFSLNLPTWDKPAFACLASRFQYGDSITPEKLSRVEKAENYLKDLGFKVLRVRDHGSMARIETSEHEIEQLLDHSLRNKVVEQLKQLGYHFVSLDLQGYRTGSMNEVLKRKNLEGLY